MFLSVVDMELISGIVCPSQNRDKVRHERRDGTLHDGVIAQDDILIDRLANVILVYSCNGNVIFKILFVQINCS